MDKQEESDILQNCFCRTDSHMMPTDTSSSSRPVDQCGICDSRCPSPVLMVSCGHRFCLSCLEGFWQNLPNCERPCPSCKLPREGKPTERQKPLQCDLCPPCSPCIAQWSCLTCGESYCPDHFQPHMLEEDKANHQVCNAENEDARKMGEMRRRTRWCLEHRERPLELFCKACRVCVCTLCPLLGAHKGHPVTLIQQEATHKKILTSRCLEQLDQKRNHVLGNIHHIEQAATDLKAHTLASKDMLTVKFTELRLLLDEEEKLAKKFIEDKAKLALWAYEGQTESCHDQLCAIDKFKVHVTKIRQQPDALQLIQDFTAVEKEIKSHAVPAEQLHPVPVKFEHVEKYYSAFIENLKSSIKGPPAIRIQKDAIDGPSSRSTQNPGKLIKTATYGNRSSLLKYARTPTLDLDTMHPKLRLSEDLLTVQCAWLGKFNANHPPRFDKLMQILSRDSYFSGSHYWEVDVLQAGQGWWIGITYPSIQRKGDTELSRLGWTSGSWCIKRYDYEYWAFHKGERKVIHLTNPPEKIGIFLDYESGVLSFFDVTSGMKHLHTFRCRFTEPLHPALRLWAGSVTMCRLT
ncbi:tripartite motif-containing protein 14 isoform X1 [Bufo bufo]|uniref:tripartite motif-containing protein 14 isoform X1 n=1 Tax=Bufo bufo TaxID=8384 RepID=UPI001ABDD1B4|nr:tripartite motif-containing protein 14 isoform X1 [Bufo bufo]